ncbi:MAG: PQQ-binding-like beta-propeller repeat protein [Candidatus Hinthialibacter antarcticus]|nr:PQQ-binding-like beta-propeller repeat protein [Candidatus Hinthialibacter antarcticus]
MRQFALYFLLGILCTNATADDWPTYRRDFNRSGVTAESLPFPLQAAWIYQARQSPERAWDGPNPRDYWQRIEDVPPRMTFDRAYHASIVDGRLYYASSADDSVVCLDAKTGEEEWIYIAGGPVRLSPTVNNGRVYFGCDDGAVYCLDAASGKLMWRYFAEQKARTLPGNQRLISPWAIRTGVVIEENTLYFAAGLFPEDGAFLCALDAVSGEERWKQPLSISPQGFMLASATRLYVPTGRSTPAVFDRANGEYLYSLGGSGGAYALLTDDRLYYGPGRAGSIDEASSESRDWITSFAGRRILVTATHSFMQTDDRLSALDRVRYRDLNAQKDSLNQEQRKLAEAVKALNAETEKENLDALQTQIRKLKETLSNIERGLTQCVLWDVPCEQTEDLILAGDALIAGGDGVVVAYRISDGKHIWKANIQGRAYGLSVADGQLFVSTDKGAIYTFGAQSGNKQIVASPEFTIHQQKTSPVFNDTKTIMQSLNRDQGYALILADDFPAWADAMRDGSNFHLAGIDRDEVRVQDIRKSFFQRGDYGRRISVHLVNSGPLPFTDYVFNLIVCDDPLVLKQDEGLQDVMRMLRPHGGVLAVKSDFVDDAFVQRIKALSRDFVVDDAHTSGGWLFIKRGGLPGEGQWTHPFSTPGNSANSGDQRIRGQMQVQWFGRPGPQQLIDRHHRGTPPLSLNGTSLLYGNEVLTAFDAYNGAMIWERRVPNTRRVGIPYDAGNLAMSDEAVFLLSKDECLRFDTQSGDEQSALSMPRIGDRPLHWGYLALTDGAVLGSAQEAEAARTELSRAEVVEQYNQFRPLPLAQYLFALDANTGETKWTYQNGLIPNISIAADGGFLYFVESRNPEALLSDRSRLPLKTLLKRDAYLVALDIKTGKPVWEQPVDLTDCEHVFYLSASNGVVTIVGSGNRKEKNSVWYYVYAFDAANGELLWRRDHANSRPGIGGDHAEQVHHPVLMDDVIVAEPLAYKLKTGEPYSPPGDEKRWSMPNSRGGCGTISGSAYCVYYRNSNPMIQDLADNDGQQRISSANRTGCWINVIAAGGVLLMPEASSGCTCNYSIQTSIAFIPVGDSFK